jgi:hypothetical protein
MMTGRATASCDLDAANGPWSVVVRRHDGSFGSRGAVLTFPVGKPAGGLPVDVNGVAGAASTGIVTWPLAGAYARVRGDLDQAALVALAARTAVRAGRPQVRAPAGYAVVWSGPYRAPAVHQARYASAEVDPGGVLGNGLAYTGLTTGGGFEDQLYQQGSAPGGRVGGSPALVSQVAGGNATLAWQPQPGTVAYLGYSGSELNDAAVEAMRRLAARTRYLSPAEWRATNPFTQYRVNEPG